MASLDPLNPFDSLAPATDPITGAQMVPSPVAQATFNKIAEYHADKLGGIAQSILGALALPRDVYAGRIPIHESDGNLNPEVIDRAADLAGLVTSGTFARARAVTGAEPVRPAAALPMDDASRLARAKQMGFDTETPISFGVALEGERVAAPAVNANGKIFIGPSHTDAEIAAENATGLPFDKITFAPIPDGFVTDSGRYVSRHEAADIARRAGQGETSGAFGATRGLASENTRSLTPITASVTADEAGRESLARQIAQLRGRAPPGPNIAATEPGLSGGQGVWGTVAPLRTSEAYPFESPVQSLWHRSERPWAMDVSALADHEIQAVLEKAWENGHDAVLLRNYSRPGGTRPEDVMVARDPAQLRSPNAAFDPAKRDSANLLASGAGILGAGYSLFPGSSDWPDTFGSLAPR